MSLIQRTWFSGSNLYGDEPCKECAAMLRGKRSVRIHKEWHAQLDADINGMNDTGSDGYVCDPLPNDGNPHGAREVESEKK